MMQAIVLMSWMLFLQMFVFAYKTHLYLC